MEFVEPLGARGAGGLNSGRCHPAPISGQDVGTQNCLALPWDTVSPPMGRRRDHMRIGVSALCHARTVSSGEHYCVGMEPDHKPSVISRLLQEGVMGGPEREPVSGRRSRHGKRLDCRAFFRARSTSREICSFGKSYVVPMVPSKRALLQPMRLNVLTWTCCRAICCCLAGSPSICWFR